MPQSQNYILATFDFDPQRFFVDRSKLNSVVTVVRAVRVDVVLRVVDAVPLPIGSIEVSPATDRVGLDALNGQGKLFEVETIGELDKMLAVVAAGILFWFFRAPMYIRRWSVIRNASRVIKGKLTRSGCSQWRYRGQGA